MNDSIVSLGPRQSTACAPAYLLRITILWLRPIEVSSWDGETLRLRAPNSYVRVWFESQSLAGS